MTHIKPLLEALVIALIGGTIFNALSLPLPWMLGPLTAVMLWQGITKRTIIWPKPLKSGGLIVLGIAFGLYFTLETIQITLPYLMPYIFITAVLILISIFNSSLVTKWIDIDRTTSVFGSIPGGLTEMVIVSEEMNAKSGYVMVFQTIRILVVLFTVPFIVLYAFAADRDAAASQIVVDTGTSLLSVHGLWLIIPAVLGIRYMNLLPAGIIIIPLVITTAMNLGPMQIPSIPGGLFLAAQLCVGTALGKSLSFDDVKYAGKYGFVYGGLALFLIFISFGFGYFLYTVTSMSLPTALLSTAPGGLVEMVLTASMVGADPAVVTSLQLTRIILIILIVPASLKWYFSRKMEQDHAAS